MQAVQCNAVCNLADFALSNVVNGWVVLGAKVTKICDALGPEVAELTLGIAAAELVELSVHNLVLLGMIVWFLTPTAVVMLHWVGTKVAAIPSQSKTDKGGRFPWRRCRVCLWATLNTGLLLGWSIAWDWYVFQQHDVCVDAAASFAGVEVRGVKLG